MLNEWKTFTLRQKIVLFVYALISLPLMPFYLIFIPLAWWIAASDKTNKKPSLIEFFSVSVSMSILTYLYAALIYYTT